MCERRPRTGAEMSEVSGVGEAKLARYGAAFIGEIAKFCKGENFSNRSYGPSP